MRRCLVLWVTVLFLLPRCADAKSLFGWLDALSGPGPFGGFEVSAEVWCFGVDRLDVLNGDALNRLYRTVPRLVGEDDDAAYVRRRRTAMIEALTVGSTLASTVTAASERFKGGPIRSCHDSDLQRLDRLSVDQQRNVKLVDRLAAKPTTESQPFPFTKHDKLVRARRRYPIGVVLGYGDFTSTENSLLDPKAGRLDEPQVRARLYELTFNVKAHPAVDVGAGFGFSRFTPNGGLNGEITGFDTTKLHIIPASVVTRPARLVTDDVLANVIGIQLTVRKLPALRASDFGVPSTATSSSSYHVQGEFQWGWSVYVDLVSLAEHFRSR